MNSENIDLYDPVILQYNKKDEKYHKRQDAQYIVEAINPMCGDSFHIYFDLKDDVIENVSFSGYGCAVSKASTSILVEVMEKQNIAVLQDEIRDFLQFVGKSIELKSTNPLLKAFEKVRAYPGRAQCVILSWKAIEQKFVKTK